MSETDRIFRQFAESHGAGEGPEPLEYLGQVEGADRTELAAMITGFLERAPRRTWDAERYAGSRAERAVRGAMESADEPKTEPLPALLKRLRDSAQLRRDQLVGSLSTALGVGGQEQKVGLYYHQLETGRLDPGRVSTAVFAALGKVLGAEPDTLRAAASGLSASEMSASAAEVFARRSMPSEQLDRAALDERDETDFLPQGAASPGIGAEAQSQAADSWDEIDRLFRGGG